MVQAALSLIASIAFVSILTLAGVAGAVPICDIACVPPELPGEGFQGGPPSDPLIVVDGHVASPTADTRGTLPPD